jgi:DNA-binding XRE family transcriptional regulator
LEIIESPTDLPSLTTTDRLIEAIYNHPDGLTIKQLAHILNRPISMIQICLKTPIASQKVTVRQYNDGQQLVKLYIPKLTETLAQSGLQFSEGGLDRNVTPIDLREVAGLTKIQLAAQLGVSIKTINNWEQRRSQPKLIPSQLKQMMDVYQCTLDELIAAFG